MMMEMTMNDEDSSRPFQQVTRFRMISFVQRVRFHLIYVFVTRIHLDERDLFEEKVMIN